jgi:hypothetical protein
MRAGDDERFRHARKPRRGLFRKRGGEVRSSDLDVKGMERFVETRRGVEAYVEPRTLQQPMTVVLVAHDGEWLRFTIPDERVLHSLQRSKGVPVYEAARTGYPRRMKEYRRDRPAGDAPPPDELPPLE